MNTDMDLFELILFSTFIMLIFACFMVTAVFFTGGNPFLIFLSLAFGLLTIPFSNTVGGWWTLLKAQEREKLNISQEQYARSPRWLFLDFGVKGNILLFRCMSVITAVFAAYNLIKYMVERS